MLGPGVRHPQAGGQYFESHGKRRCEKVLVARHAGQFLTLREHCDSIRAVFCPKMWQLPLVFPQGPTGVFPEGPAEALKFVDEQDGKDVAVLYQPESSAGHHPYAAYPSLEEVNGLEYLRVRKGPQEEGEDAKYIITIYESPYSAYGEAVSTKAQFMEFIEARNGQFLRDANFD